MKADELQLTKNFFGYEVIATNNQQFTTVQEEWLRENPQIVANATTFALLIAQPLRDYLGEPLSFTSWGRSPGLNKALPGASPTSLHTLAMAGDFVGSKAKLQKAFKWLLKNEHVGELIAYLDAAGELVRIHVSLFHPKYQPVREVWVSEPGKKLKPYKEGHVYA